MKYKYTRKEIVNMWGDEIPTSIEKDLLATVDKPDKYGENYMYKPDKECICSKETKYYDCPIHGGFPFKTTPSPLDEIEEINMATYQGKRDTAIEIMIENKLNELVKAVNSLKRK